MIDRQVALAAAPALYELLASDATEICRDDFDRVGLLLGRLAAEGVGDPSAVCAAAIGEGRHTAFLRSKGSVLAQALEKPASELTRADAFSFACSRAWIPPSFAKGYTAPLAAAGFATTAEFTMHTDEWFCK
eukprot:COSAG02_NODE_1624_length_11594_cov_6.314833_12_plen_132_part_00